MEALKLRAITANGKLTVSVPEEFDNKEVEIIVLSSGESGQLLPGKKEIEEKITRLLSIIGSAKYPDMPITKYDSYNQ